MKTIKLPPYNHLGPAKLDKKSKKYSKPYKSVRDISIEFNHLKKSPRCPHED